MNDLDRLIEHFPNEALFHEGRYFQLKRYQDNQYALSISEPGPCGDKTPHPLLKFQYHNHHLAYSYFADFVANPMVTVYASEDNLPFFKEQMVDLLAQFNSVFPVGES